MSFDLFISYSRRDNARGRVTTLKEQIEADYRGFANKDLHSFFDITDIGGSEDWRHRILQSLRESHLFLLVLTPSYLESDYCGWEVVEFLKYEHARAVAGQGVTPIYFVEIPGLDSPGFEQRAAYWLARVRRRNHFDLRPGYAEGANALKRGDVRARLADLNRSLHERLTKLSRIAAAPGNLPAQSRSGTCRAWSSILPPGCPPKPLTSWRPSSMRSTIRRGCPTSTDSQTGATKPPRPKPRGLRIETRR